MQCTKLCVSTGHFCIALTCLTLILNSSSCSFKNYTIPLIFSFWETNLKIYSSPNIENSVVEVMRLRLPMKTDEIRTHQFGEEEACICLVVRRQWKILELEYLTKKTMKKSLGWCHCKQSVLEDIIRALGFRILRLGININFKMMREQPHLFCFSQCLKFFPVLDYTEKYQLYRFHLLG